MELPADEYSLLAALEAISPDSISDLSDKQLSELLQVECCASSRGGTHAAQACCINMSCIHIMHHQTCTIRHGPCSLHCCSA